MNFFSQSWNQDSTDENFLKIFSQYADTKSGVKINQKTAFAHSVVYSCVKVISESISSLPLILYKEDEKGNREKAKKHSLYQLLKSNPNNEVTTMQWRETMVANLCLNGNHFTQIIRNGANQVVQLWGLDTTRMTAKRLQSTGEIVFIYEYGFDDIRKEPKKTVFTYKEILNIAGLSFDGICGISPIAYEKESIALSIAYEQHGSSFFKNGASPSGIFSIEGELSDEAFKRMKEDFDKSYTGMKNSNKPMVLEGGAKFSPITMTNTESQFLEGRRYQKEDIAMIFRVPLHMLNDLSKASYNSIEQLSLGFVIYTLHPWLVRIEQCMQRDLLTEQERKDGYYIKHNLAALLRGDLKTRFEVYDKAIKSGIYTIDDILRLEDVNTIGGEQGQSRFMQGAMTTVQNVVDGINYNKGNNNA